MISESRVLISRKVYIFERSNQFPSRISVHSNITTEHRYEKRETFQGKTCERHAGDTVQETKTRTSWGFDEDVEIHSRYCEYGTKCGDVSEAGSVS